MKKILSLLSVVIIALCTFTSCDEDLMISTQLKGTWEGYMDTYYTLWVYLCSPSKINLAIDLG